MISTENNSIFFNGTWTKYWTLCPMIMSNTNIFSTHEKYPNLINFDKFPANDNKWLSLFIRDKKGHYVKIEIIKTVKNWKMVLYRLVSYGNLPILFLALSLSRAQRWARSQVQWFKIMLFTSFEKLKITDLDHLKGGGGDKNNRILTKTRVMYFLR